MSEFQNALDVVGLRPELVQHLSTERLQSLVDATGLVLARAHHPDLGGNEKLASRVNLALEDLEDDVSLKMIREEYLEDLRFSELVRGGRQEVFQEQLKRHRVGGTLVEMMLSRQGQHLMDWFPCDIQLFETRHWAELVQQGVDTVRELDLKLEEELENQIDSIAAVSDREVEAKWKDREYLFKLFGETFLAEILDWADSMMEQHHPDLHHIAQRHRANDTFDEWLIDDPVGKEYAHSELVFFEQFYERECVRKQYFPRVRKALEDAKRRVAEYEHGGALESFNSVFDDAFDSVNSFKEHYRKKRKTEAGILHVATDGTLQLSSPDRGSTSLDNIELLGALKLFEPSKVAPCPWFPLASTVEIDTGRESGEHASPDLFDDQEEDLSQALGRISPSHFLELTTKGDGRFSSSLRDVSVWIEEQEAVFRSREEGDSIFLLAAIRRQSGEKQVVCLGEVIGVTPV